MLEAESRKFYTKHRPARKFCRKYW